MMSWFISHRYSFALAVVLLLGIAVAGTRRALNSDDGSAKNSVPALKLTPALQPTQALANFYVSPGGSDVNDGSERHPWRTIQHAAETVRAGATVHVAPGNYLGAVKTSSSGTTTARIRFVSDVQWGATIRAGSVDIIWTNLGDYVDIEGFDIGGNTASTCNGIINYASYVRIVGNNVHDVGHDAIACGFGSGIVNHQNRAGQDDDVIGNVIHDIGDIDHVNPLRHGIYHANLRGHIWNNLVYRCEGWGIHLWHAANQVTIANNTIFNNGYGGILIGDGDDPGGFPQVVVNDHTVVINNIIFRNGLQPGAKGYGIEEYGLTGRHNQYLSNLVYENGPRNWNLQNEIRPMGAITADPQFVNYQPDGSGDYQLRPTSPAHRAGAGLGSLAMNPHPDIGTLLAAGGKRPASLPWP